jgi:serine/threonine protein kinase
VQVHLSAARKKQLPRRYVGCSDLAAPYAASGNLASVEEARRFGRYRVTGTLGAGAMGEVYCAVDDVLGREVAVKTLKNQRNALAARMTDDRFRIEARAIASLSHPGVVQVFDIDLEADPPYLVMERVAGPSLKDRLASGPLSVHEVRALGIQIARALAAAHERKIIHRDVKPANILAATDGAWKLADFGVAHVPDSSLTMTGQFIGSPAYAPPEALVRGQSDSEGDVYGLGATLYQAASGRWPRLDAPPSGALLPPVPPLHSLAPSVPPDLAAIIDRACALDPGARPSAAELADALAGASSSVGAAPVPSSSPAVHWKPWAIGGGLALATLILILATRGGGAAATTPNPGDPTPAIAPLTPPPAMEERDVRKILDQVEKGHYREALDKLDEWEEHNGGATPESDELRRQIEALGEDQPRGPPGKGRGKKGKHGD